MIIYNCRTCKNENRCALQNDYALIAFFSFGRNVDVPDCHCYQPSFWHGIEGVWDGHTQEININRH